MERRRRRLQTEGDCGVFGDSTMQTDAEPSQAADSECVTML